MILVALCTLALAAPAPSTRPAPEDEVVRLEAWPEPADPAAVAREIGKLRKARTEEMERSAREALEAIGDAAGPALLKALEKERDEAARERVARALEAATGAAHTRLFAAELESRSGAVRRFALLQLARHPDPGVRAAAEAALARAEPKEGARPDGTEAERAEERELAALACAAAGSPAGLALAVGRAAREWKRDEELLRVALGPAKGPAASRALVLELASKERARRLAALRLLSICGEREALPALRPVLDDGDRDLQAATVDALRAIVDGDPPLGPLPVFELIEHLQAWKERSF